METTLSPGSIPHQRMSHISSGSMSTEMERDFLKEKIEHFKVFIKKLQDELHSQKIRKEGAETVSKLLQESKHQTQMLQKKAKSLETVVRNLQSRLEQNGLSSEVTLQEGEEYFPGHSKNLLDNLTRENARLRNVLRNNNGDPEELMRVQKELDDSVKDNTALQARVATLEQVLKASDNDKDRTITQLREQMSGLEVELMSRRIECTELDEEKRKLENQLRMVAQQCHELAQKLHSESAGVGGKPTSDSPHTQKTADETGDTQAIKDENTRLNKSVQEVTKMNRNWQQYNSQREEYVRQLQAELNELKGHGHDHSNHAHELEVQMNKMLDEARRSVNKAHHERDQMKRQFEESAAQSQALQGQVAQLRRRSGPGAEGDAAEVIDALKAQVQICTEDFESERRDREKAQSKLVRMEGENDQLKRENENLKRERQQFFMSGPHLLSPSHQQQPVNQYTPYHAPSDYYGNEGFNELAARGARNVVDGGKNVSVKEPVSSDGADAPQVCEDDVKDVVMSNKDEDRDDYLSLRTSSISSCAKDSVSSNASSRGSRSRSPSHDPQSRDPQSRDAQHEVSRDINIPTNGVLQCPRCHTEYTTSQQLQLLEHMEDCCD